MGTSDHVDGRVTNRGTARQTGAFLGRCSTNSTRPTPRAEAAARSAQGLIGRDSESVAGFPTHDSGARIDRRRREVSGPAAAPSKSAVRTAPGKPRRMTGPAEDGRVWWAFNRDA